MAVIAPRARPDLSRHALKRVVGGRDGRFPWLELLTPDMVVWEDDFLGDQMRYDATAPGTYQSTASGTSAATAALLAGTLNGVVRLDTGTDNGGRSDLSLGLHFQGQLGAVIAVRLKIDVITAVKVEVGFTDVVSGTDAGAVDTKATPTFTDITGDRAVWILDTTDNDYWEGVAGLAGTAATTVEAAISPTAAAYETLIVALQEYDDANGYAAAKYLRLDANGRKTYESTWQSAAITSTVNLTPWVFAQNRSAAQRLIDVDYIRVWQRRTQE